MKTQKSRRLAVVSFAAAVAVTAAARPIEPEGNWPAWRGADGQGVSHDAKLPTEWSASKNVAWKTPIPGRGHSSPIVWGGRIFLTTALEGDLIPNHGPVKHYLEGKEYRQPDAMAGDRRHTLQVLSVDAQTGKILWTQTGYDGAMFDDRHKKGSYAAPTPITDGTYVYAYFGTEGLYAYDFTGKQIWKTNLGKVPALGVGVGTSPVLHERVIVIQADEDNGDNSFVAGIDKTNGKELWRVARPKVSVSWATPLIVKAGGGRTQLVTASTEQIIAYDPLTGKELWRTKGLENNAVPSPVAASGLVIVSSGYPEKKTMAIRVDNPSDAPPIAWEFTKGSAYVPSPIVYKDFLYLTTDRGVLTCLDVKTGAVKYEGGRPPVPATFTASPVAYADHLFMVSEDGDTFVIKAGPTHEIVRTNSLGEPVYASPALANGVVYIRAQSNLYAIRSR